MAQLLRAERRNGAVTSGELLDLGEVRLLRRARHRDPTALGDLWERIVDDAWSVARALVDEHASVEVLLEARDALSSGAPGLPVDRRWLELPFGQLFSALHRRLELPPLHSIDPNEWSVSAPPSDRAELLRDPEAARRAVRLAPPEVRLFYLFTLLTPCSIESIARFGGVRPSVVRRARTAGTWQVLRELRRDP
jgi:hypothetical protein